MFDVASHVRAALWALQFQDRRTEGLWSLTDGEWRDLLSHRDFFRCMVPLRQTCGDQLPDWVRLKIDQRLEDNAERLERIKGQYSRFSDALRCIGASHLVIKGFTLWPGFVDHPRFRLQSDIDIYCPPESISGAHNVLVELGYAPETQVDFRYADHLPTMVPKSTWKWRGNVYDPEMPASFELHHSLWNEKVMRLRPTGLDQFWNRRVERRLDGISFPALSEVDTFGYAALHLTRNLLREQPSLHQIYELARFLNVYAENRPFWKGWEAAQDDSLRRLEAISCQTAALCFACHLPDEIEREIAGLPVAVTTWFAKFTGLPMSPQSHPRRDWVWLHVSLVESFSERLSVLRDMLLPTQVTTLEHIDRLDSQSGKQEVRRSPIQRRSRYIAFVCLRLVFYFRLTTSTLWRGARFWWSTKGARGRFHNRGRANSSLNCVPEE